MIIKKRHKEEKAQRDPSLSTGSTLLNLALTDSPRGGFQKGKFYFLVGDSASGKSMFSMTCLAEAVKNPAFQDYRFIYDNCEDGMLMDVNRFFGSEVERKLEAPGGENEFSVTVEEFYYHLDDAFKKGTPFIYVLDSMDALESEADQAKFEEQKKAHRSGKQSSGTYGMAKAKQNSVLLRKAMAGLRATGSILIIISQTRDAVNMMGWETKTRSGGRALRFYATCEIWLSLAGAIKKTIRGKPRKIGNHIQIEVKKNRITGKLHKVMTAIYPSYGIDDIGSCIDYLVEENWWKKSKGSIKAGELGTLSREKLIQLFDEKGKFKLLRKEVASCWRAVEQEGELQRTRRYV